MSGEQGGNEPGPLPSGVANGDRLISLGEAVERGTNGGTNGAASGAANGGKHRKPRSRRYKWVRRSLIAVGLVIVLIIAGVVADYYYLGSLVTKKVVPHLQTTVGATENILLIGSTNRCALKVQNPAYGLCSQGVTGINSDIDMVIHLDPDTGAVLESQFPAPMTVATPPTGEASVSCRGCAGRVGPINAQDVISTVTPQWTDTESTAIVNSSHSTQPVPASTP